MDGTGEPGSLFRRRDLLLAAADWKSRALVLAELQEAGYEVVAVPGLRDAAKAIIDGLIEPPLIVVDVFGDEEAAPERVEDLASRVPGVPLILVVGAIDAPRWESLRARAAALLRRPVSVGEIVDAVRRTLPPPPRGGPPGSAGGARP